MFSHCKKSLAMVISFGLVAGLLSPLVLAEDGSELFTVLKREKEALQKQVQDLRKDLQDTENERVELAKELRWARGRLEDAREEQADLRLKMAATTTREKTILADVAEQQRRTDKLVEVVRELRGLVEIQADGLAAQRGQIEILEGRNADMKGELVAAKSVSGGAEERISDLQTRLDAALASLMKQRANMHFNLAVLYDQTRMFREAEREYLKCLEASPDDADAHYNLGILYDDKLHQSRLAAKHYKRFVELKPHSEDAVRVKAWLLDATRQR